MLGNDSAALAANNSGLRAKYLGLHDECRFPILAHTPEPSPLTLPSRTLGNPSVKCRSCIIVKLNSDPTNNRCATSTSKELGPVLNHLHGAKIHRSPINKHLSLIHI